MDALDQEKLIKYQQKYESSNDQNHNLMIKTGIKWVELLECAFDKRFLELDAFLNQFSDGNDALNLENAKNTLNELSSVFSQLVHKCLIVFDSNDKLQKDVDTVKRELKFVTSEKKLLEHKLESSKCKQPNELMSFNHYNNSLNSRQSTNSTRLMQSNRVMSLSNVSRSSSLFNIKCNYPNQQLNDSNYSEIYAQEEIANLRQDNVSLKKLNISLKSELFGAKLAIKYLNKELTGRIQQIQILSKSDLTKVDQTRLWDQIETEIHLSRHKTVVRACRGRGEIVFGVSPEPEICDFHNSKKANGICEIRKVSVKKADNEGLGISITGGREYGLPIIISEIHRNTAAARCGKLYIGDSILSVNGIDLNDVKHTEAARILLNQAGDCELECVFVLPEETENETSNDNDGCSSRFCYFDSRVMYNNELEQNDTDSRLSKQNRKLTDLMEFKNQQDIESEDDNLSSITNTFSSPNKLYPGIARPILDNKIASLFATGSAKIAKTSLIKEQGDSLDLESDEMSYDKIKLQTLDGKDCQIFYKNKSTII